MMNTDRTLVLCLGCVFGPIAVFLVGSVGVCATQDIDVPRASTQPEVIVRVERIPAEAAQPTFSFAALPTPIKNDLAVTASFHVQSGNIDRNSGGLAVLNDDRLPKTQDAPADNFFFAAGQQGGRLLIELERVQPVKQVVTYSWHPGARSPQVYRLYASQGQDPTFQQHPAEQVDPVSCGWQLLADIDTRSPDAPVGGQQAVSISTETGSLGDFRYLMLVVSATQSNDPFSQTFFSEIDIWGPETADSPVSTPADAGQSGPVVYEIADSPYRFSIDLTQAPDLEPWVNAELVPIIQTWYPKIVDLLTTEDFAPPTQFSIVFDGSMDGVAHVQGTRMSCAAKWFRRNLEGEAKGAVVHELVHVVQQYGRARRSNRRATPTPGWVVEGIADYIRWFLYEPESRGAEISRRGLANAKYDGNYRVTANFLNWVVSEVQPNMIQSLNTAARRGQYSAQIWIDETGISIEQLNERWKQHLAERLQR